MNILLVYPDPLKKGSEKIQKITDADDLRSFFTPAFKPNLTLLTLASLTPEEHSVHILDDTIEQTNFENDYDLIGITTMTNNAPRAYELADEFRKNGKTVVLGGWHPSALPDEAKQHADSVVIGEAEYSWPTLLHDFKNGKLKSFYRQDKPIDLAIIPPIINERKLITEGTFPGVESTRGCPVGCTFCSVTNRPYSKPFRKRPIPTVYKEIQALPQKFFCFVDLSLTFDPKHTKQLFTEITDLNKRFSCQANMHNLARDEDLLRLGAEAGLTHISVGLESPYQTTINAVHKKTNVVKQYISIVRKLHDYGFSVLGFFMFGFDNDTCAVFDDALDLMYKTEIEEAGCCILTPFPGTLIFEQFERERRLLTRNWSEYYEANVVFQPKHMTPEELMEGTRYVAHEFYSLGNAVKRTINSLRLGPYPFFSTFLKNYNYYRWAQQF